MLLDKILDRLAEWKCLSCGTTTGVVAAPPEGGTVILSSAASMPDEIMPTAAPEGGADMGADSPSGTAKSGRDSHQSEAVASPAMSAEQDKIVEAASWLDEPEHDIGFDLHKGECGARTNIHDPSCERCAVEIALAAYADHRAAALTAEYLAQQRVDAGTINSLTARVAELEAALREIADGQSMKLGYSSAQGRARAALASTTPQEGE